MKAGTTSVMQPFRAEDSSSATGAYLGSLVYNTAGLTAKYRRAGDANWTTITLATATAGTWTSGGFCSGGSGPTSYEIHWPNAMFAAGVPWVEAEIYGATNLDSIPFFYELDAVDYQDAVRLGLTALPNAAADAAGGLPISDAGGLDLDAKLANTNEVTAARMAALTDWIDGGRLDLILDLINGKTTNLPTDPADQSLIIAATDAVIAAIAALNNLSATQVNAEVLDVLNVDTFAQPGQGAPAATTTIRLMLAYLYKAWRNRSTQTASEYALYADDATTKDHEAAVSDDGTTYERGEIGTGA